MSKRKALILIGSVIAMIAVVSFGVFFYINHTISSLPVEKVVTLNTNTKYWRSMYLKDEFKNITYISVPSQTELQWRTDGVNGGDSSGILYFTEQKQGVTIHQASSLAQATTTPNFYVPDVVALVSARIIKDGKPLSRLFYNATPFPFVEVSRKPISIKAQQGTLIVRDVKVSKQETRREMWAEFPNVNGTAFEFAMNANRYSNSEEVFNLFLDGIVWDIEKVQPVAKVSTKEWKICSNKQNGYEFLYPKDWKISVNYKEGNETKTKIISNCDGDYEAFSIISPNTFVVDNPLLPSGYYNPDKTTTCEPNLQIAVILHDKNLYKDSEQNYSNVKFDDQFLINQATRYSNKIEKIYILDGVNAFALESSKEAPCQPMIGMNLAHNNSIYSLNGNYIADDTFETILSTFKFLK